MILYVYVLQAKDLPVKNTYVKLQVGKHKSKTSVARSTTNPAWNEEFVFRVRDVEHVDDVIVSVVHDDEDTGLFNVSAGLVGRVRIPLRQVAGEENQTQLPTWFVIEKPRHGKSVNIDCGKILLSLSLKGNEEATSSDQFLYVNSDIKVEDSEKLEGSRKTGEDLCSFKDMQHRKHPEGKQLMKAIAHRLEKLLNKKEESSKGNDGDSSELRVTSNYEDAPDRVSQSSACIGFDDALDLMRSRNNETEAMPENLRGGVLLDQSYLVSPCELNKFLFKPDSQFNKELAEIQGTTDVEEGPWEWTSGDDPCLTRVVTYTRAATKLVKAVKATEEQTYLKGNGQQFAVHVSVSTPDVPYGDTFKVELLYKILPGLELSSGEESSQLVVSWGIRFHQNTMMKGMIEGGVRQGLKESFEQFACLLANNYKILDSGGKLEKDQVIAALQSGQKSDLKSALRYFWNFTVISAILMFVYLLLHIMHCEPSRTQGLEFYGLDLPDSFGELFTSAIVVLFLERVYWMTEHFIQASLHKGSDQGVKAHGEGWILTIALIKGKDLASVAKAQQCDPYVVFTCNGLTRTSSVKLQAKDPQWNEVIEFDAMEEPPSMLDVEVFDFDGPFDQGASLGHAEINFLKHTSDELADLWVPLEGNLALTSQSKLHLRIFLENNNGVETMRDYLSKVGKAVGKKLNIRSPHKNCVFQKLFGLPDDEFLIKDFTCQLKRKLPLQGKLYLSARIVGFYSNLLGHKTKFYFLWEDIDDIQVRPPTFSSVGSPLLVVILKKGRGLDAKHGAKSLDEEGRLRFCFQSFVSFDAASRTIFALWKTRTLSPYARAQIVEEEQDLVNRFFLPEDVAIVADAGEFKTFKVYTCDLPADVKFVMEIFNGGELEHRIMEKSNCVNYANTTWECVKPGVFERRLFYKFNRRVSIFGGGVTSTQQKSPAFNDEGWIVNEIMALHDVPFGDHFCVHVRYEIKNSGAACNASRCEVSVGIRWLKTTKFEERITRNVTEKLRNHLKGLFELVLKEECSYRLKQRA